MKQFKVVTSVPEEYADRLRQAVGDAGGGAYGNYSHCFFSVKGTGTFKPLQGAQPFIGQVGKLETVIEERIEFHVTEENLQKVLEVLKKVHPYEVPVIDIYQLVDIV